MSADQSEDEHRFGLPDAMRAILRLQVHLWILHCHKFHFKHTTIRGPYPLMEATHPILVIEHDGVRRGEVDAKPSSTRAQEKEVRCSGLVTALLKTLHLGTTLQRAGRSVDAA